MTACAEDEKADSVMAGETITTWLSRLRKGGEIKSAYEIFPRCEYAESSASFADSSQPAPALPMSSDDSIVDRISSFVSGNKRGIVIGVAAAAVAVGGVAYYVASSRVASGAGDEESLIGGKKKDKKKKKHRKSAKDKDGPVLEEKKPQAVEESDDGCVSAPPPPPPPHPPLLPRTCCSLTDFWR